jgi:hypothetical protein
VLGRFRDRGDSVPELVKSPPITDLKEIGDHAYIPTHEIELVEPISLRSVIATGSTRELGAT